jgi:hypothetical protein
MAIAEAMAVAVNKRESVLRHCIEIRGVLA